MTVVVVDVAEEMNTLVGDIVEAHRAVVLNIVVEVNMVDILDRTDVLRKSVVVVKLQCVVDFQKLTH